MQNGQSNETLTTQDTGQRKTTFSKNNKLNITEKTRMISNTDFANKKTWGERKCSLRVNGSCFLLDTRSDTHIVRSDKCLLDDRGTKKMCKAEKIHCDLR